MYQSGDWPEIEFRDPEPGDAADEQQNHDPLARLLEELLASCEKVELYGCWNGELAESGVREEHVVVDDIRAADFVFRERCKYIVKGGV